MSRIIRSFGYAFSGIAYLVKSQPNARVHAAATIVAIGLGAWLGLDACRWAVLAITIASVWSAEALNTAVEDTLDLTHPDNDPLAKSAKDVAAAGVLLAALGAVAVGVWLLIMPFFQRLGFGG